MKVALSPFVLRVVAIGVLALVIGLAFVMVVSPMWASWSLHAERVDMLKRQAATMEALADASPRFADAAKKMAANVDASQLTFSAPQPTLAVAQLQGQISQLAASASATVTSSQPLPESRIGALTKITVQTMLDADVKALTKVLHGIDAARPLLKVEKFVVRDPDGEWAVAPQAAAANKLQVEIVVSSYTRAP